jgi:hypothetical protein
MLHSLVLRQELAKGLALERSFDHILLRPFGHANSAHAVMYPSWGFVRWRLAMTIARMQ